MKKETKKAPDIRFRRFTDDWEQRKLGDICGVYDGVHQTPDYQEDGVMFLSVENIATLTSEKYISEDAYNRNYKVYPEKGDILMTRIGDVGTPHVVETNEKLAYYVSLALLKPKGIDSYFLNNAIQAAPFQKGLLERTLLTAIPMKINKDEIGKVDISFPVNISEQKQIGSYFRNLDNLVTLHQRKLDQLKTLKKYFLQNMFPAKGEKVPRIRFKGFTGDWEQHKVIDLLNLLTDFDANGSFADMAKNVHTFDGSGFAWYVRMTDLENPKPLDKLKYVDKLSYDFLRKTHLYGGELLMAKRGNIGEIYIFEPRTEYATVAPNMYLLKLNEMVIPRFLYTFFISDEGQRQLIRLNASTTMGALYKDDVKNINVIMPKIGEQEKIAEHFSNLEYIITLHQRKLTQLQTMKKFMLQNLFI